MIKKIIKELSSQFRIKSQKVINIHLNTLDNFGSQVKLNFCQSEKLKVKNSI